MKIKVGNKAPDFSLESVNKGTVSLKDYTGKRVVLVFGRYFGCPVCQADFDELLKVSTKIDDPIVYFTQSLEGSTTKYLENYEVNFPVIPVPKTSGYQLYKDYNVGMMGFNTMLGILRRAGEVRKKGKVHGEYEGRETQSPADFVVDESGKIIWANKGLFDSLKLLKFLGS